MHSVILKIYPRLTSDIQFGNLEFTHQHMSMTTIWKEFSNQHVFISSEIWNLLIDTCR